MSDFLKDKRSSIAKKLLGSSPKTAMPKQSPQELKKSSDDLDDILAPTAREKERDSMDAGIQGIRQGIMGSNRGIAPEDPMERYRYMERLNKGLKGLDFSGGASGASSIPKELRDHLLRLFFEDEAQRLKEVEESMSDFDNRVLKFKNFYGAK